MRLELLWFDDVKQIHTPHNDFKQTVKFSMGQEGLLCPMVVDWNNDVRNGANRFAVLKKGKLADGSLFYKAKTPEEVNFLGRLNVAVWERHIALVFAMSLSLALIFLSSSSICNISRVSFPCSKN